jgi:D-alanine-D-alanine ligase
MRGMDRLTVGVIFGGRSVEHDVSVVTAHQAMAALSDRHDVVPIYMTKEGRWFAGEGLNDLDVYRTGRWDKAGEEAFIAPVAGTGGLTASGSRLRGPRHIPLDVVVCAVHGTFGEDGTLQGLLELAGLPYTGSGVVGSAVGMDKTAMKKAFRAAGLPVVDDVEIDVTELDGDGDSVAARVEDALGYPVFVKPVHAGSSVGIGKASDRPQLLAALDVARNYDTRILVERGMEGCIEINCSVLGGPGHEPRASVCEQPVAWEEFLSFSDKYMRGGKGSGSKVEPPEGKAGGMASAERRIPAPIPDETTKQIQENALAAFRAVGASGVARVDSFLREDTGETWLMEINTMPGSFSFYLWEASGLGFPDLMDKLMEIALETHRGRSDLMFSFDSGMLDADGGSKSG